MNIKHYKFHQVEPPRGSPAITQTFNRSFTHLFAVLHHIDCCQFYAIKYGRNPSMAGEREREREERAFQGTSVLSAYFSDPLCLFVAFNGLDIGSTRSKIGGCSTTALQKFTRAVLHSL